MENKCQHEAISHIYFTFITVLNIKEHSLIKSTNDHKTFNYANMSMKAILKNLTYIQYTA